MKFIHPHLDPPPARGKISVMLTGFARAAILALAVIAAGAPAALADGWDPTSAASNTGSIANTRHNLTVPYQDAMDQTRMNIARNNYGEVCVYCHTPHGANSTMPKAPLWNRTNPSNTYTLYNLPLTSGQAPTQPGVNSVTCLSCHDGTVGVDSIINMPGSGRYSAAQETAHNEAFLDTWPNPDDILIHDLDGKQGKLTTCQGTCHNPSGWVPAPDFTVFVIGTDLTDDHPVGVQLPDTATYDFKAPGATDGSLQFFDTNGDGRADNNEVRFYDTGEGYEVECASCHDPHGVESAGPGSEFIPSFLRVNNNNASSLCLTCHDK
ncbi:MAG: cytochrome c3 family protein [Candidatus Nitrospinota bacterium M3_3B_026]